MSGGASTSKPFMDLPAPNGPEVPKDDEMNTITHYPLLFEYKDLIAGNGFLAGVAIAGRALIREDGEGSCMYGIQPGGICADGDSQKEAVAEFRSVYRAALYDMAAEAPDFDGFRREVQCFFEDQDRVLAKTWTMAVAAVRQGDVASDWLGKQPADSPRNVEVVRIAVGAEDGLDSPAKPPEPGFNALDGLARAA